MGIVNKEEQLERIADALEGINDNLERLSECIGYIPPNHFQSKGYYFLRIAGNVDTN